MASSGVFELVAYSALHAADVFCAVDTTDATQAAQGSLKKITAANVFANAQPITIASGTVTVSTPPFQATQTWNAGGVTFTAIDLNVTSTASAAGSLLMNLRLAGTSQWKVDKAGNVTQLGTFTTTYTGPSAATIGTAPTGTLVSRQVAIHHDTSTATVPFLITSSGDNAGVVVYRYNGTAGSPTQVVSGNQINALSTRGYTSGGDFSTNLISALRQFATENWSGTGQGAKTLFYVTPNTTAAPVVSLTLDQDKSAAFAGLLDLSAAAAGQVKYPSTQNASADVNTLDDYKETISWTPSVGGTATYTNRSGGAIKIGRFVIAWFKITINAIGTGSTTNVTGLPYTEGGIGPLAGGSISYFDVVASTVVSFYLAVSSSATDFTIRSLLAAGGGPPGSNAIFQNGTRLEGFVTYYASA